MGHSNCDICGNDKKMCSCPKTYVIQEGGDHYQAEYQHWDWVNDIGMGYLPGNATKYVSRWRKKNGTTDLKKAMTYIDKMIAIRAVDPSAEFSKPIGNGYKIRQCNERFIEVNKLGNLERNICEALSYKCDDAMLSVAKSQLATLVRAAGMAQAPAATQGNGSTPRASTDRPSGAGGMANPFGYNGEG